MDGKSDRRVPAIFTGGLERLKPGRLPPQHNKMNVIRVLATVDIGNIGVIQLGWELDLSFKSSEASSVLPILLAVSGHQPLEFLEPVQDDVDVVRGHPGIAYHKKFFPVGGDIIGVATKKISRVPIGT